MPRPGAAHPDHSAPSLGSGLSQSTPSVRLSSNYFTSKYLNNVIEADHGALKRVIRPTRGFQRMRTASATLKGFEVMRMIRRGHCILQQSGATGEIRLVNQLFGLAA
jgi:transposase-like protein